MPHLPINTASHPGPLDAVVAIEHLLLNVGGSKSERLCHLHQRLRQLPASMGYLPFMLKYPKQEDDLEEAFTLY